MLEDGRGSPSNTSKKISLYQRILDAWKFQGVLSPVGEKQAIQYFLLEIISTLFLATSERFIKSLLNIKSIFDIRFRFLSFTTFCQ